MRRSCAYLGHSAPSGGGRATPQRAPATRACRCWDVMARARSHATTTRDTSALAGADTADYPVAVDWQLEDWHACLDRSGLGAGDNWVAVALFTQCFELHLRSFHPVSLPADAQGGTRGHFTHWRGNRRGGRWARRCSAVSASRETWSGRSRRRTRQTRTGPTRTLGRGKRAYRACVQRTRSGLWLAPHTARHRAGSARPLSTRSRRHSKRRRRGTPCPHGCAALVLAG